MLLLSSLVLAVVVLLAVPPLGRFLFERRVEDEVRALLGRASARSGSVVRASELEALPLPVRRWLEVSGVVGRARVSSVRLRQRGQLRTALEQPWMPVEAEQYFTLDEPGFVWKVRARMLGFVPIVGRDRYADGRGHMRISLTGVMTVADAVGPEIDQGALLRFLAETVWFPSAVLEPYVRWEPIDATSARATLCCGGVTASAVFFFDERGRFSSLEAERYFYRAEGSKLEPWVVVASDWRALDGIEVPVRGQVTWRLAAGPFDCFRWELTELEYDRPALYADEARARRGDKALVNAGAGARAARAR